jgi:hypothetical protein
MAEEFKAIELLMTEMRVQNANILTTIASVNTLIEVHAEKFVDINKTLAKINKDIDGNGNYKEGMRYKYDQIAIGIKELKDSELRCPGRNVGTLISTFKDEVHSAIRQGNKESEKTLESIKALIQFKAGEQSGEKEATAKMKAERRAKMGFIAKWIDIIVEAPLRSALVTIMGMVLLSILTWAGCHKQIPTAKEIITHAQNGADYGGTK